MTRRRRSNGGYALLAVLWLTAGLAGLAFVIGEQARLAVSGTRNRIVALRSTWLARGCLAQVRAEVASAFRATAEPGQGRVKWNDLSGELGRVSALPGFLCIIEVRPLGARLSANRATREEIVLGLQSVGLVDTAAAALASALEDWRDGDDLPSQGGAETDWYAARRRSPPTNRPFRDVAELKLVRGFEVGIDTLFEVEDEPIAMNHANSSALSTIPGLNSRTARTLARVRSGQRFLSYADVLNRLHNPERASVDSAMPWVVATALLHPRAWAITLRPRSGLGAGTELEVRVALAGAELVVETRRIRSR